MEEEINRKKNRSRGDYELAKDIDLGGEAAFARTQRSVWGSLSVVSWEGRLQTRIKASAATQQSRKSERERDELFIGRIRQEYFIPINGSVTRMNHARSS